MEANESCFLFFSLCLFILNFLLGFHGCYEFQQLNTPNAVHNLASQQNSMRPDFILLDMNSGDARYSDMNNFISIHLTVPYLCCTISLGHKMCILS